MLALPLTSTSMTSSYDLGPQLLIATGLYPLWTSRTISPPFSRGPNSRTPFASNQGPQLSGFDGPNQFLANRQFAFRGFENSFPYFSFGLYFSEIYVSQIQQLKAPHNPTVWILFLVNQDFTVREIRKQFSSLFQLPSSWNSSASYQRLTLVVIQWSRSLLVNRKFTFQDFWEQLPLFSQLSILRILDERNQRFDLPWDRRFNTSRETSSTE